jgi:hypothetical protein
MVTSDYSNTERTLFQLFQSYIYIYYIISVIDLVLKIDLVISSLW